MDFKYERRRTMLSIYDVISKEGELSKKVEVGNDLGVRVE